MESGVKIGARFDHWVDEWKMACSGILLATREWQFLLAAVLAFVFFGTLMNLLSGSTAALSLFGATDWPGKFSIIWDSFLANFGVGRPFWDWLLLFSITFLQSILIGLIVVVWQKKRRSKRDQLIANVKNADNLQSAGLVAGLAVLGSGCPTCGTTLLMPVMGALFSSSAYALAGILSGVLTAAAILLALFSLKRIGKDAYVRFLSEEFSKRRTTKPAPATVKEDI